MHECVQETLLFILHYKSIIIVSELLVKFLWGKLTRKPGYSHHTPMYGHDTHTYKREAEAEEECQGQGSRIYIKTPRGYVLKQNKHR